MLTGDTVTLNILGRGRRLYRCCKWVSSSSFWYRTSGACALPLTGVGCGTKVGGSKSPTGAVSSTMCSGCKYRWAGGSILFFVAWRMVHALLTVMRSRNFSISYSLSWGASLWHCIAVAKNFVVLMILSNGVIVEFFMEC